ncbi:MAG TPA: hypothetical protein VKD69_03340 [Vicinamibacterales bacterium]|nr:hypothetical protein [Vicinamibacterales bacterium]
MTDIRRVDGRRDFRRFIDYAYDRNRADPHWVPPLRLAERERLTPSRNPFFEHAEVELLLAWRGNRVVGRIAAIDDRLHLETHRDNVAMFGFFEAADQAAAAALLTAAEDRARARGRSALRGPINPSLHESGGLLIDGFDSDPVLMMPHNPPEYASLIERSGYCKVKDLFAWIYDLRQDTPAPIARLAQRLRDRHGITVRQLNLKEFTSEVERLRQIYCAAWDRNWGFVPPTAAEFRRLATELKPIFDPRAAVVAEADGQMVACLVSVPDVNQALKGTGGRLLPLGVPRLLLRNRYITQVRLLLLGVDTRYRAFGLYPMLIAEWHRQLRGTRYTHAEFSWVLEDNLDVNQPAAMAGARHYKTYRIYQKTLA